MTIQKYSPLTALNDCRSAAQHRSCGRNHLVNGNCRDAMRLWQSAISGASFQSSRRLQNARFPGIGAETQRAIAVVRIAVSRVPRDDDGLAAHRRRQVRASAVISDKQMAAFKHSAHL